MKKLIVVLGLVVLFSSLTWGQGPVLLGPHIYTIDFGKVPVGQWSSDYLGGIWWPLWVTNPGSTPFSFSSVDSPDNATVVPMCQLPWVMPARSGCLVYLSLKPKRKGLAVQAVIKVGAWTFLNGGKQDLSQPVQLVADGQ